MSYNCFLYIYLLRQTFMNQIIVQIPHSSKLIYGNKEELISYNLNYQEEELRIVPEFKDNYYFLSSYYEGLLLRACSHQYLELYEVSSFTLLRRVRMQIVHINGLFTYS